MDKAQLILLGLPIFLFCSDLFNLFTPPPPKPQPQRPHQPPPHIPHQQHRPAAFIPETLDFPSQKTSGLGGAIGYGHTVEINFCVSCSFKGTAVTMKKMLETAFPGLDVILANYPPPQPKRLLAKVVPVAQMGVIGMIVAGDRVFPMIGIAQPPAWFHSLRANRFGSMASTWLIGNFLQSYLQSSGAFEVHCDGELVFSKLKEGRFPGEIELRDLIGKTLTRPGTLAGSY
ncbi:PREDICTED: selT-like protein [Camelina sativa]|uniref:SelT-like protein n=1 Tax=Camelina sativa TaxID=90675 RepID=A0ABM0UN58_CAMSA|nr:PREDICTED: selT-like protein [Camelina sativa]XP_010443609.1 PREDICTED: selT-like protein [Camelina sativa]